MNDYVRHQNIYTNDITQYDQYHLGGNQDSKINEQEFLNLLEDTGYNITDPSLRNVTSTIFNTFSNQGATAFEIITALEGQIDPLIQTNPNRNSSSIGDNRLSDEELNLIFGSEAPRFATQPLQDGTPPAFDSSLTLFSGPGGDFQPYFSAGVAGEFNRADAESWLQTLGYDLNSEYVQYGLDALFSTENRVFTSDEQLIRAVKELNPTSIEERFITDTSSLTNLDIFYAFGQKDNSNPTVPGEIPPPPEAETPPAETPPAETPPGEAPPTTENPNGNIGLLESILNSLGFTLDDLQTLPPEILNILSIFITDLTFESSDIFDPNNPPTEATKEDFEATIATAIETGQDDQIKDYISYLIVGDSYTSLSESDPNGVEVALIDDLFTQIQPILDGDTTTEQKASDIFALLDVAGSYDTTTNPSGTPIGDGIISHSDGDYLAGQLVFDTVSNDPFQLIFPELQPLVDIAQEALNTLSGIIPGFNLDLQTLLPGLFEPSETTQNINLDFYSSELFDINAQDLTEEGKSNLLELNAFIVEILYPDFDRNGDFNFDDLLSAIRGENGPDGNPLSNAARIELYDLVSNFINNSNLPADQVLSLNTQLGERPSIALPSPIFNLTNEDLQNFGIDINGEFFELDGNRYEGFKNHHDYAIYNDNFTIGDAPERVVLTVAPEELREYPTDSTPGFYETYRTSDGTVLFHTLEGNAYLVNQDGSIGDQLFPEAQREAAA